MWRSPSYLPSGHRYNVMIDDVFLADPLCPHSTYALKETGSWTAHKLANLHGEKNICAFFCVLLFVPLVFGHPWWCKRAFIYSRVHDNVNMVEANGDGNTSPPVDGIDAGGPPSSGPTHWLLPLRRLRMLV